MSINLNSDLFQGMQTQKSTRNLDLVLVIMEKILYQTMNMMLIWKSIGMMISSIRVMMIKIIVDLSKTKYIVISVFTQMKIANILTTRTHVIEKEIEKEKPVESPLVKLVETSNLIILKSTPDFLQDITSLTWDCIDMIKTKIIIQILLHLRNPIII